ncbi:MAG: NADH-quinone oxidoreductase subunit NuoB [Negativicutes bacterium]|nr:NADH-quinone oxidoreductase subunit NuoB [Negativicutes bacterium]
MLNLLRKIMMTGTVTETYDECSVPDRFRGEVTKTGNCGECSRCVDVCPSRALAVTDGQLTIAHKACLFCGRCVEICEYGHLQHTGNYKLAGLEGSLAPLAGAELKKRIRSVLGRSLNIRHVDAGSCNACDFEMTALNNPIYDLQQYGIDFVASPRHADMLMVTGTVTRNLTQALKMTYEATPAPKLVMAVGACAGSGKTFGSTYAIRGGVEAIVPIDIYVPGCPPRPSALLYGLFLALERL